MTIYDKNGKAKVIGDYVNCVECGKKFYRRPQTRRVCCEDGCQEIRNRRKRKERREAKSKKGKTQ